MRSGLDKFVTDQAEGLRRLLARDGPRVIAVTGGAGSPGRTTTVVNLAAALTEVGRQVLVIDECGDESGGEGGGAADVGCGESGPGDESGSSGESGSDDGGDAGLDAPREQQPLAAAIVRHPSGFGVLTATRAHRVRWSAAQLGELLRGDANVVLIDAALDDAGALSPLALHAHDLLLVTGTDAHAITATYACIKRLHFAHAIAQFRVLANHVQNPDDARVVLDNLVGVASRYLAVALERAGCIAADPHMPRAVELARPIVDAFPSTAAARDYRRLAAELPHWPMRPALAAATRLTDVPEVSTVTSLADAAPARAGWPTGPSAAPRATQHA